MICIAKCCIIFYTVFLLLFHATLDIPVFFNLGLILIIVTTLSKGYGNFTHVISIVEIWEKQRLAKTVHEGKLRTPIKVFQINLSFT